MAPLLFAKDLALVFPTKRIFCAVTLSVDNGNRIGIVGKNGDGKSSLLRLLSGNLVPDAGEVTKRSDVTVGLLSQADSLDPELVAITAATGGGQPHKWAAERRTREIIEVLCADIDGEALVKELSGGQRRRVDLARLLIGSWDILMLDEPTNHLDIQTITWLAEHLKTRWPEGMGALLVITHDRWFLDEVCTSMWEVHDGRVSPFEGGYSAYILQRVERDRLLALAEDKRQNLMRKELAWLSRGARARATKPKFHVRIAQELIANEPPPRNTLELRRTSMSRLGKQVIEFVGVTEILGEKTLLQKFDFLIGPGDRIAILGSNGSGKTTLLRLMSGELSPTSGQVKIGQTVKLAYMSQQLSELSDVAGWRVLEVLKTHKQGYVIDGKYVSSTEMLKRLGFEREYLTARVKDLSGGQKRRLQLLLTLLQEPNVMLLDEPGNDFDTDMLTVLEDLLDTWPGTLVLVSHDRYLVERVTDMQYALIEGQLRHLPGGVDEYLEMVKETGAQLPRLCYSRPFAEAQGKLRKESSRTNTQRSFAEFSLSFSEGSWITNAAQNDTGTCRSVTPVQNSSLSAAETRELKKQLFSTERKMNNMEEQIERQKAALHAVDPADYLALIEAQAKIDELQAKLTELETTWLNLSEKLET